MKFIVTKELGRLAKWLRILGYDTAYFKEDKLSSLLIKSLQENRVILTRNNKLKSHRGSRNLIIKSDFVNEQLQQVVKELALRPEEDQLFSLCTICNQKLKGAAKAEVKGKVAEYVFQTQSDFLICPTCQRIYWRGTHWENVAKIIEKINR
jgi:uncharacterized protein with PIN domain